MSETKSGYKTDPSFRDQLIAVLDEWQWLKVLVHVSAVVRGSGFGEIKIVFRDGEICDLSSTMTEKPRRPKD